MESYQVDTMTGLQAGPSNVTILDMTEDCTRLVFDRLTLNQLIHLRAVCHAWNDIITQICEQKSKLIISFSKYSLRDYFDTAINLNVDDDLQFQLNNGHLLVISSKLKGPTSQKALKRTGDGSFSEQQNDPNLGIRFIARLFPNITNFVCDINYQRLFELNYILWKWSTSLNTLTISFSQLNRNVISRNAHQDLVKCFEQMSSLKRLHLLLKSDEKLDLSNIATFGQLEEFTFDSFNISLEPYFGQLDANSCTFLRVINHSDSRDSSPNLLNANPELTSKLTHLSTDFIKDTNHISQHFVKFKNLIQLEILDNHHSYGSKFHVTMADVLKEIVPLKKLQILVFGVKWFFDSHDMEEHQNNPNYRNSFPIFHNTITELRLMDKDYRSHLPEIQELQECKQYQLLARIFPMVRKIRIYSNNLNEATFDAQIRPQFSEAFGERVEVTFYHTKKFNFSDLYS